MFRTASPAWTMLLLTSRFAARHSEESLASVDGAWPEFPSDDPELSEYFKQGVPSTLAHDDSKELTSSETDVRFFSTKHDKSFCELDRNQS